MSKTSDDSGACSNTLLVFRQLISDTRAYQIIPKEKLFYWIKEYDKACKDMTTIIKNAEGLTFYNTDKSPKLKIGSSEGAIRVALMQETQPIEFASAKLTQAKYIYIYGLEKFDQYTCGKKVAIINNHQPPT
ncbi:retrovirus-related Pol polyprotein from [Elysia marginata]|uniref:Retrovirus-related Pol polyprotein from n=1 Tax=Elysia marginata TaxID=1093978 RepID=A0AAV4GJU3_9GAST|nr:retrovirus-related Pol polyprotein from [Elysia marginata]